VFSFLRKIDDFSFFRGVFAKALNSRGGLVNVSFSILMLRYFLMEEFRFKNLPTLLEFDLERGPTIKYIMNE